MIQEGETVPDFTLDGTRGEEISEFTLSEVANGRPTMLVFYVHDFSPVCTTQMCEVNDMEMLTFNDDAAVVGLSSDGPYSHQKFIEENNLSYPLLTDTSLRIYREFGLVEDESDGGVLPKRGIVLLDGDRTVRYLWEAESNWDDWSMSVLSEANDIIDELTNSEIGH